MESSDLGSWLLGDEMGLGKTLAALSRLVESARANMGKEKGNEEDTADSTIAHLALETILLEVPASSSLLGLVATCIGRRPRIQLVT
jgi:SNF2 family DNA or RNA helicase